MENVTNLLLGRLLPIISNNNIHNKFTNLTEVAFNLGKELLNIYNLNKYKSLNKDQTRSSGIIGLLTER